MPEGVDRRVPDRDASLTLRDPGSSLGDCERRIAAQYDLIERLERRDMQALLPAARRLLRLLLELQRERRRSRRLKRAAACLCGRAPGDRQSRSA